jgi:hypothetical protein
VNNAGERQIWVRVESTGRRGLGVWERVRGKGMEGRTEGEKQVVVREGGREGERERYWYQDTQTLVQEEATHIKCKYTW